MKPWERYQAAGIQGPWTKYQGAERVARPTLQETAEETYGYEDLAARGTILPMGRTQEGEVVPAVPQVIKDMTESALLPGHAYQGGTYTPEDVTRFTMDIAAPMTAGKGVGAARSALPAKKGFVKAAPDADKLRLQAREQLGRAKASGVITDPDSYMDMLASAETATWRNKMHPGLHPRSSAALDVLSRDIGKPLDVEDLMVARRLIGVAQRGVTPELADDRRIAGIMEEMLDDYVENLSAKDVLSGQPEGLGMNLRRFRNLWSRMRKTEVIDEIVENANIQASGFENGIRTGFRQLLKNKKRIRGFTKEERALMQKIVEGGLVQKGLRLLGKMSFGTRGGSNWLGGTAASTIGGTAGGLMGGPMGVAIGGAIPPAVGYVSQKAADAGAQGMADLVRAITATGGNISRSSRVDNILRAMMESGGPILAATPEENRPLTASQLRDMF